MSTDQDPGTGEPGGSPGSDLPPDGNPYVGPHPFRTDQSHLFFGRDREARDLHALVIANRVVLLFAQSGAGKSSLINARLVPDLLAKNFEVLPVTRVSGECPDTLQVGNIFVFNLETYLDEDDAEDENSTGDGARDGARDERFAGVQLSDFLMNLTSIGGRWLYHQEATAAVTSPKPRRAPSTSRFMVHLSTLMFGKAGASLLYCRSPSLRCK